MEIALYTHVIFYLNRLTSTPKILLLQTFVHVIFYFSFFGNWKFYDFLTTFDPANKPPGDLLYTLETNSVPQVQEKSVQKYPLCRGKEFSYRSSKKCPQYVPRTSAIKGEVN